MEGIGRKDERDGGVVEKEKDGFDFSDVDV